MGSRLLPGRNSLTSSSRQTTRKYITLANAFLDSLKTPASIRSVVLARFPLGMFPRKGIFSVAHKFRQIAICD